MPKVSIIIPTFNRKELVKLAIESILNQSFTDYEIIVVDDGSTDGTRDCLNLRFYGKFRYFFQSNSGRSAARNRGIKEALGEYIAFLDSDDLFAPEKLSLQVSELDKDASLGLVYSRALIIDEQGKQKKRRWGGNLSGVIYPMMLFIRNSYITTPSVMTRASVLREVGGFDETMDVCEDLDLWRRISRNYRVKHLLKPLAIIRERDEEMDVNSFLKGRMNYYEKAFCDDPDLSVSLFQKLYAEMYICYSLKALHQNDINNAIRLLGRSMEVYPARKIYHFCKYVIIYFKLNWRNLLKNQKRVKEQSIVGQKVCIVSHVLPPSSSGQAIMLYRILKSFSESALAFVSVQDYSSLSETQSATSKFNCEYYKIYNMHLFSLVNSRFSLISISVMKYILQTIYRSFQLYQIVIKERPAILIACSGDLWDIPSAALVAKLTGTHFIPYFFDDYSFQWIGLDRRVARFFEPFILQVATRAIVPNEFLRSEYLKRYGFYTSVIHNPTYIYELSCLQVDDCLGTEEIKLIYTGAIYHAHYGAFRNLIEAMRFLADERLRLHIYTTCPLDVLAKEGISGSSVIVHDHLSERDVPSVQQGAGILFLPLAFDSSIPEVISTSAPGKLGEYLAAGRPILAHVPAGSYVGWYIKENKCGVVVDINDPNLLAEALGHMLADAGTYKKMAMMGRFLAERDFSLITAQKQFDTLIKSVLHESLIDNTV